MSCINAKAQSRRDAKTAALILSDLRDLAVTGTVLVSNEPVTLQTGKAHHLLNGTRLRCAGVALVRR
jgi:hypothetical protein